MAASTRDGGRDELALHDGHHQQDGCSDAGSDDEYDVARLERGAGLLGVVVAVERVEGDEGHAGVGAAERSGVGSAELDFTGQKTGEHDVDERLCNGNEKGIGGM